MVRIFEPASFLKLTDRSCLTGLEALINIHTKSFILRINASMYLILSQQIPTTMFLPTTPYPTCRSTTCPSTPSTPSGWPRGTSPWSVMVSAPWALAAPREISDPRERLGRPGWMG